MTDRIETIARLQAVAVPPTAEWAPIGYLNAYRLVLSMLFLALSLADAVPAPLGVQDQQLFTYASFVYLFFAGFWIWSWRARSPRFAVHLLVATLCDLIVLATLMYASGGVNSGLGMLIAVAVAGGSILSGGRIALLFAASASLLVLAQQALLSLGRLMPDSDYTHGGMLGVGFFATAALAQIAARRVRASESLAEQQAVDLANLADLNEHIIQRMQSGVMVVDADRRIRLANGSAQVLIGLPDRVTGSSIDRVAPLLGELLQNWRELGGHNSWLRRAEVTGVELSVSFASLGSSTREGAVIFIDDAAAVYQRAQELKLASLGRLTASIAHEIRNPLGAISHAGELLAENPSLPNTEVRLTEIININAQRVDEIIENVLGLSRRGEPAPETLDLGAWLIEFRDEFSRQNAIAGELHVTVKPSRLVVHFDPGQLRQVLWNLCENGFRHAHEPALVAIGADIHPDSHRPYLDVIDNGDGLSEEHQQHVFEPFFTTRSQGSGLGLYLARELCQSNQATLTYMPAEDGARFRISFSDLRRQGLSA
jgi:two-component system, NtrC family, sensor histidine kinase PilS